jgi:uncharacterized protein (TIGR02147 family)
MRDKTLSAPDIFDYEDYRLFLKDFYDYSKKTNKNFSHRYFALKAGYSSSGFLHLIIEGKRNLSRKSVPKFARAIELNIKEQIFFDALVSFNQSKEAESKEFYGKILQELQKTFSE